MKSDEIFKIEYFFVAVRTQPTHRTDKRADSMAMVTSLVAPL